MELSDGTFAPGGTCGGCVPVEGVDHSFQFSYRRLAALLPLNLLLGRKLSGRETMSLHMESIRFVFNTTAA